MLNSKLLKMSFLQAIASSIYIVAVSFLLTNGEKLFGKNNNILGGVAILLLLVISATIMGTIILGRPILMYLEGQKKEALKLFFFTLLWLVIIASLLFLGLAIY